MKTSSHSPAQLRRRTILSFLVFFGFLALSYAGWQWVANAPKEAGIQGPLRKGLQANEKLFAPLVSPNQLVATYPVEMADKKVRYNGNAGLKTPVDSSWRLQLVKQNGDTLRLDLATLRNMPKTEIVFDFKCIEGWSQRSHWGGVRVVDFMEKLGLKQEMQQGFMGLQTPDGQYYVGIDMASALHPQTLLAYEMNDQPLPLREGWPLRLIIPVKYGIKHLKRIGTMQFSHQPPKDYWAERGYDYFSGH